MKRLIALVLALSALAFGQTLDQLLATKTDLQSQVANCTVSEGNCDALKTQYAEATLAWSQAVNAALGVSGAAVAAPVSATSATEAQPDITNFLANAFIIGGFVNYNQLGTPRITGGVFALYKLPVANMYGSTSAIVTPKSAVDPTTRRPFYAISANIVQHVHYDVTQGKLGRFNLLVGVGAGPSFSQAQPSGINVTLNSSFMVTPAYQITRVLGIAAPIQMLYINGVGWNPVAALAATVNLKNLTGAK